MALLKLFNKVSEEIDDKFYSVGIFLDISKAFDIIDHSILPDKRCFCLTSLCLSDVCLHVCRVHRA